MYKQHLFSLLDNIFHKRNTVYITVFLILLFVTSTCRTLDQQHFHQVLLDKAQSFPLKGDHSIAQWGKRGLWLLSGGHAHHHLKQIYFYNLPQKTLKRMTHQDGAILSFYMTPKWIYYASTTDELKTHSIPPKIMSDTIHNNKKQPHLSRFPTTEIYRSHHDSFNIERITHHAGYDGDPQVYKDIQLFYNSIDKNQSRIYKLNLYKQNKKKVVIQYPKAFQIYFRFSNDFKNLVWKHWNPKSHQFEWVLGNSFGQIKYTILKDVDSFQGMVWNRTSDAILFSSNHIDGKYKIFLFNLKKKCLTQVFHSKYELTHPVLSPDGLKIAFLRHKGSHKKEVLISIAKDLFLCPDFTNKRH